VDQPIEERPPIEVEPPQGIFAFPKGAKAGLFMHAIFENLDFTKFDAPESDRLLDVLLERHGFGPEWKTPVREMVGKVLTAPLLPGCADFTLSRTPTTDRLNELEFHFPMNAFSPQTLGGLLEDHAAGFFGNFAERMARLEFTPVKGFMKGFMDLVFRFDGRFWLVDWKSNYLGPTVEDYGPEAMDRAMSEEFYVLQYLIYTVALDRYLRRRVEGYDYERDFGGVFYLFLRGVDPARPDGGIYRAKPSADLIERLAGEMADFPLEPR
jgi:exodeoxyribonuclease V beta subunit